MGDRTAFSMTVHDCPDPAEGRAIMTIIQNENLSLNWDSEEPDPARLVIGEPYTDHEMSVGTVQALGFELKEAAPHATWEIQEDPAYEHLGDVWWYAPDLGDFRAEGDAQGQPVFGGNFITTLLAGADSLEGLRASIGHSIGVPWEHRFDELRKARHPGWPDPARYQQVSIQLPEEES